MESLGIRSHSSTGQSAGLSIRWLRVQIPLAPLRGLTGDRRCGRFGLGE